MLIASRIAAIASIQATFDLNETTHPQRLN
jgi:hypothetical protein